MGVWSLAFTAGAWMGPLMAAAAAGILAAVLLLRDYRRLERQAQRLAAEVERLSAAHHAAEQSAARHRAILDAQRDAVVARDARGIVTYANQAFAELVQHPLSSLLGASVLPPPARIQPPRALSDHALLVEEAYAGPQGERWIAWTESPILGGPASGVLRVGREIPAPARDDPPGQGGPPSERRPDGARRTARTATSGMMGLTSLLLDTPLDADQKRLLKRVRELGAEVLACLDGGAGATPLGEGGTAPAARTGPPRVLLVEDNEINALIALQSLEKAGAHVEWVRDGGHAIAAVEACFDGKAAGYDLVLMDLRMPEIDGLEAARRIRAMEAALQRSEPLRIVALTATTMQRDRQAAQAAGIGEFLPKPYRAEALAALLAPAPEPLRSAS